LEAAARAIFQSWFVDFDPVHAKGRGQQPGRLAPHIAALIPDDFSDSVLGQVPRNWSCAALPEIVEVNPGRALRKGEIAPYLDMANMPTQGHFPDSWIDRPFSSGMRFFNGDTLVARITPCLENGKTAMVTFLEEGQIGWGSTEFIVLRPKPPLPSAYGYLLARSEPFRQFAIQRMSGSSGRQRVPADSLSQFMLVKPTNTVAEAFGALVEPMFRRADINGKESRALAGLRDILLPKLISGELRVTDAERIVGRCI
jgi:type I restriction enzyme S subunit